MRVRQGVTLPGTRDGPELGAMIVDLDPTVPNRQAAIASGDDDVTEALATMGRRLQDAGADFLVMVCNTAHVFLDGVRHDTSVPFINIVDESVAAVRTLCPDARLAQPRTPVWKRFATGVRGCASTVRENVKLIIQSNQEHQRVDAVCPITDPELLVASQQSTCQQVERVLAST